MVATAITASPVRADSLADFYAHRTVTLISGFTPNGENDVQLRLVGRYLGAHLPGQPQVVIANMPGAGTLIAANQLKKAAPDGTTAAMFTSQAAVEPFLGNKAALFDPLHLGWLGSISQDRQFCGVMTGAGVPTTFEALQRTETTFGAGGPTSDIFRYTAAVRNLLGAKIKLVSGYAGMPAIRLALARGEVSGVCGLTEAILRTTLADDLKSGRLKLLVQMGRTPTTAFGDVPSIFQFAKDEHTRKLVDFIFRDLAIGRPLATPSGVPKERLDAMRKGFMATLKDPGFLAEAQKIDLLVNPSSAEEITMQMQRVANEPKPFFDDVKKAYQ